MISRDAASQLLLKQGVPENVIRHCVAVEKHCLDYAMKLKKNDLTVNLELLGRGALLHDIGRSKTHGVDHGVVGADILRKLGVDERLCLMAERHVFAGINKKEAVILGLPARDLLPVTTEEKLLCEVDNLTAGEKLVSFEESYSRLSRFALPSILNRMKLLHEEVSSWLG